MTALIINWNKDWFGLEPTPKYAHLLKHAKPNSGRWKHPCRTCYKLLLLTVRFYSVEDGYEMVCIELDEKGLLIWTSIRNFESCIIVLSCEILCFFKHFSQRVMELALISALKLFTIMYWANYMLIVLMVNESLEYLLHKYNL